MPIECQKAEQNSPSQSRRCAINSWRGGWLFTTQIGRKGWNERKFRLNIRTCWQRDVLSYKVAYKCNRKPVFWIRRTRKNNREWRKCYREQLYNDRKGDIKVIYLHLSHSSLLCFCSNPGVSAVCRILLHKIKTWLLWYGSEKSLMVIRGKTKDM